MKKTNKKLDRRDFLKSTSAVALGLSFPYPLRTLGATQPAALEDLPILVVLYLRGGMDALNAIIPYKDSRYYAIRPTISISPKKTEDEDGVIVLDKTFGMHPAMAALKPLWDDKSFAPIICSGSPHSTRSHFDAQDFMEYAAPGLRQQRQGWLNRYLDHSRQQRAAKRDGKDSELRALALQGLLPSSLRGPFPVLAVPGTGRRRRRRGGDQTGQLLDLFDELYRDKSKEEKLKDRGEMRKKMRRKRGMELRDDAVIASGAATIRTLRRYGAIQDRVPESRVKYPGGGFGPKLRGIAKVIRSGERIQVAGADWNGWDHHQGEGAEDGRMAQMLDNLSKSIAAFMTDIGQHKRRTLVLVMTEFGRTCRENGNRGTDHGHGGAMFAVGGPVLGGQVLGKWNGLEDADLYQARDLAVTTDFRDIFNEVLLKHMKFKAPKGFFPNYKPGKGPGILG